MMPRRSKIKNKFHDGENENLLRKKGRNIYQLRNGHVIRLTYFIVRLTVPNFEDTLPAQRL